MKPAINRRAHVRSGSALLAVLWLSAALSAIAFSVATTVRGETQRAATSEEDVRAYYLAAAGIQRAVLHMEWGQTNRVSEDAPPYFISGQPRMDLQFPSGDVRVEIIPETSKIDLNRAKPELLESLLLNIGAAPERAGLIAAAIVDWRSARSTKELSPFDQLYLSQQPSFRPPHASFQDIEELLYLQGMTPDLFYGTWERQGDGDASHLAPRPGLRDCVSVFGSLDRFDVNTVPPAVLGAYGVDPGEVQALLQRRNAAPFSQMKEVAEFAQPSPLLANRLMLGPHTLYTLRATARMRRVDGTLSDMRRTISALIKMVAPGAPESFHILRWYDRG